jgi:glycosyltransferase involved in cell wall biosynthesis
MENKPSDSQPAKIGVIIPAYRVERQIATVISSIPGWVDEIIVVNDASPDATGEKIRTISDPRLHVLTHTRNQGVGGAMLTGYDYALKQGLDIMVKVDGDGQMDLAYLSFLINPIHQGESLPGLGSLEENALSAETREPGPDIHDQTCQRVLEYLRSHERLHRYLC